MRILFMGNNWVAWQIVRWLKERGEEIVGLVVHPVQKQKYGKEIINSVRIDRELIFDGSHICKQQTIEGIKSLQPQIGLSVLFGYIISQELLEVLPDGCVNLHPALLPYNRGAFPNVWSIIEGNPAGVTLHYVDAEVDTGDIIAQRELPVEPVDTGQSLYRKLERTSVELFVETWPLIRAGRTSRIPQQPQTGTYHRLRDVERVDEIELDRNFKARELIDIIRARTFSPYPGAYFRHNGRKVYMRMELIYEEALRPDEHGSND